MQKSNSTSYQWDVLGLGCVTVDDFLFVPHYPEVDSKMRINRSARQGGGLARTALVAAARLGARCAYAGLLGHDDISRYVLEDMQRENIDLTHVVYADDACPMHATVIVDTSSNTRTILYSADGRVGADDNLPSEEIIRAARVLLIDEYGMQGNLRAVKIAKSANIPIVGDFEKGDSPLFEEVIDLVDHLILSLDFAKKVTGEEHPRDCVNKLWSSKRSIAIVTCGKDGSWITDGSEPVHCPTFRVPVLDTTGCGDVFHGVYSFMLAHENPILDCVKFASAAAALKAQNGAPPSWNQVEGFIATEELVSAEI